MILYLSIYSHCLLSHINMCVHLKVKKFKIIKIKFNETTSFLICITSQKSFMFSKNRQNEYLGKFIIFQTIFDKNREFHVKLCNKFTFDIFHKSAYFLCFKEIHQESFIFHWVNIFEHEILFRQCANFN